METNGFHTLPVYKNSLALRDLSDALGQYFSPDSKTRSRKSLGLRSVIAECLVTDAALLPLTIEKTHESKSLNYRLQNATFINVITKNIMSYCNGLEKDGVKETEYVQLLRKEMKTFRKSFKLWRKSLINGNL